MRIVGLYPFKGGGRVVPTVFPKEYMEVQQVIQQVNASQCMNKVSREKTMKGRVLYSPSCLNELFEQGFKRLGWQKVRVPCEYSQNFYVEGYRPSFRRPSRRPEPYREMDFMKNGLGVEVQFGKYAFMVYNVCAKMTIFHKLGYIQAGIEIVPVKELADQMSTGVSFYEQFVWDLEHRGESDIDIPVLVMGVIV